MYRTTGIRHLPPLVFSSFSDGWRIDVAEEMSMDEIIDMAWEDFANDLFFTNLNVTPFMDEYPTRRA